MPTKKIAELGSQHAYIGKRRALCGHPEHNPPSHMVFEPGIYEHTCPACGKVTVFRVDRGVRWSRS